MGYAEQESDSVWMWDMCTTQVIATREIIWLKQMFFQSDESGILELESLYDIGDILGAELGLDIDDDVSTDYVQASSTVVYWHQETERRGATLM